MGPDDKVAVRTIQATRTLGDQWVVEGGLADGERVIVAGGQKVQPGMVVRAVAGAGGTAAASPAQQPVAGEGSRRGRRSLAEERLARSSATK